MKKILLPIITATIILAFGVLTLRNSWGGLRQTIDNVDSTTYSDMPQAIESVLNDNFSQRNRWINLNGLFQKSIFKTADIEKDWYKMDDGELMYARPKMADDELVFCAEQVDKLQERYPDIPIIYLQMPYKVTSSDELPTGVNDYGYANADVIVSHISKARVIDLRDHIDESGIAEEDRFFKTDHHWRPQTALWAASLFSERLSHITDWEHNPEDFNYEKFNVKTYENQFLGSVGKRIGNWYAGTDDFDVIAPKWDTEFEFVADSVNGKIERTGSFEDALLEKSNLEKDYFNIDTHATYTGGDYKLNTVENKSKNVTNDKNILLIKDSFSSEFMPFFALSTSDITTLDLRHYKAGSVYDYIDSHDFDIVIVAYNPSTFRSETFTFDRVYEN